jgi:hypothetical protein
MGRPHLVSRTSLPPPLRAIHVKEHDIQIVRRWEETFHNIFMPLSFFGGVRTTRTSYAAVPLLTKRYKQIDHDDDDDDDDNSDIDIRFASSPTH